MTDEIEELAGQVIDAAMQVHVDIGPDYSNLFVKHC